MTTFWWITVGGLVMSALAMVGSVTLLLSPETLNRLVLPLAAFVAGILLLYLVRIALHA